MCIHRNILESFGHLSERDKAILMKYPFHRIGSLLSKEEVGSSSVVKDALTKKEGEEGNGMMQLVQAEGESQEQQSSEDTVATRVSWVAKRITV